MLAVGAFSRQCEAGGEAGAGHGEMVGIVPALVEAAEGQERGFAGPGTG